MNVRAICEGRFNLPLFDCGGRTTLHSGRRATMGRTVVGSGLRDPGSR